jgi:hypothetical protein
MLAAVSSQKYAAILHTIAAKAVPETNYTIQGVDSCGFCIETFLTKQDTVNLGLTAPTFYINSVILPK